MNRTEVFIVGAGGHAKVVIDIVEKQGLYKLAFLVDDSPRLKGESVYGYPVIGGLEALLRLERGALGLVAIGDNATRQKIVARLVSEGFSMAVAVHPSAQLARGARVADGSVVMAGAVINSDARIGRNAIINTKASVDHDCILGDGVHVAPGASLCGGVRVGKGTFICAGATVIPNLTIGENVVIGAGATVVRDIPDGTTAIGTPARCV